MWIDANKQKPEEDGRYIVCTEHDSVFCTMYYAAIGRWGVSRNTKVAYWASLPAPPRRGEKDAKGCED